MHSIDKLGPTIVTDESDSLKVYFPFPRIVKLIQPGRNGKSLHVATLGRWRDPGVRARDGSRIRLRCVRFPSGWRTSIEWVHEFLVAITSDRARSDSPLELIHTTKQRRRQHDRVDLALDAAGIRSGSAGKRLGGRTPRRS
jgi:hypothetical protein